MNQAPQLKFQAGRKKISGAGQITAGSKSKHRHMSLAEVLKIIMVRVSKFISISIMSLSFQPQEIVLCILGVWGTCGVSENTGPEH